MGKIQQNTNCHLRKWKIKYIYIYDFFSEQKMEQGILIEQCQRLQRTNVELHKNAESLSRRMAVSIAVI